jgi:hypothetical protein
VLLDFIEQFVEKLRQGVPGFVNVLAPEPTGFPAIGIEVFARVYRAQTLKRFGQFTKLTVHH